jgi:hypothetical protein
MNHIVLSGDWKNKPEVINTFITAGFIVSLLPDGQAVSLPCDLIITRASKPDHLLHMKDAAVPWLAWCAGSDGNLTNLAYQYGARAFFPEETSGQVILQYVQKNMLNAGAQAVGSNPNEIIAQRRYQKGDIIILEPDTILEVQKGILAQTMVHEDGSEVLLGLFGAEHLVIPHPSDTCYIQLIAYTDLLATIKPWMQGSHAPDFPEKLRSRLQQMEAWAAMQARPHLDQRVLGILSLLAEQFGLTTPEGRVVDVRITHSQLASAVGATRATITRTIRDLRHQNKLSIVSTPNGERFCLLQWEQGHHGIHA